MSDDNRNTSDKLWSPRSIGAGLTRSNLITSGGSKNSLPRRTGATGLLTPNRVVISGSSLAPRRTPSDREVSLTAPNRVGISGTSLTPRRTPSDRYQSAYQAGLQRLGGSKNVSEPSVASTFQGRYDYYSPKSINSDAVINQGDTSSSSNSLPASSQSGLTGKKDVCSLVNPAISEQVSPVRELSSYSNRHYVRTDSTHKSDSVGGKDRTCGDDRYLNRSYHNSPSSAQTLSHSFEHVNCDIDLENCEEDVSNVKVQSSRSDPSASSVAVNTISTKPVVRPDSGYYSPRGQLESHNSFKQSLSEAYSENWKEIKTDSNMNEEVQPTNQTSIDMSSAPQRPARKKSLSRKKSGEFGGHDLQLSPRQPEGQQEFHNLQSISSAGGNRTSESEHVNVQNTCLPQCTSDLETVPKARPRPHRKLTKREIGFKRVVRLLKFFCVSKYYFFKFKQ